jgi:hypothetical protein
MCGRQRKRDKIGSGEEPTKKTRGEQARRDREMRKQGVERSLQG